MGEGVGRKAQDLRSTARKLQRKASMLPNFKLQCHFILIFLAALRGDSRYLEVSHPWINQHTFLVSRAAGSLSLLSALYGVSCSSHSIESFSSTLVFLPACFPLAAGDALV